MARTAQASANTRPLFIFSSLKRDRILSGQRSQGPRGDRFDRAAALDPAIPGSFWVARRRPLAVVVDQRPGLRPVHLEALLYRVLAIVVALHQRLARLVVVSFALGGMELHVVAASRGGMHAPAAHARDDLLVRHVDLQHVVQPDRRAL